MDGEVYGASSVVIDQLSYAQLRQDRRSGYMLDVAGMGIDGTVYAKDQPNLLSGDPVSLYSDLIAQAGVKEILVSTYRTRFQYKIAVGTCGLARVERRSATSLVAETAHGNLTFEVRKAYGQLTDFVFSGIMGGFIPVLSAIDLNAIETALTA